MRSPVKRFLIGFVIVYAVVGIAINWLYGPPGFSSAFQDEYQSEIDRYYEITKSYEYKLWEEKPDQHPPDETLASQIAFVEEFRATPAFQAEMERRERYLTLSDWFNVIMLVVLAVRLATGPLRELLANMAAAERDRIETVERKRSAAARQKAEAERKLELLDDEREASMKRLEERIAEETHKIEEDTGAALEQLRKEAEDRKRHEEAVAQRRLKALLVDEAIAILEKRFREEQSVEQDEALLDRFLSETGGRQ